jgi:HD-GYP domain-containing protein (c-di-GMP phosphodiesterase class II)
MAIEVGLSTKQVEEIGTAGLLHDVGKIHEEFAPLLRKEDKLTDSEFALMQTHSAKGAELVGVISSFRGAIQGMVMSHHERWDGNGYPDGLSEDDIPFGSRIIMVCDTIDAMLTDRPYRKALGFDAVLAELQRCKESQFDARLVDLVESSLPLRRVLTEHLGSPVSTPVDLQRHSKRVSQANKLSWRSRLG